MNTDDAIALQATATQFWKIMNEALQGFGQIRPKLLEGQNALKEFRQERKKVVAVAEKNTFKYK